MNIPEAYIKFYKSCMQNMPVSLIGTDLSDGKNDFYSAALELLDENGIDNFLAEDDFVFMMHQGYTFWYFKADGNPNPVVYGFQEGKTKADELGSFSDFILLYNLAEQ